MAEVQGGRNLRPPEMRKARHNKVYTAKGPRDRRVRLSANTAIQFYDVQDRLGFERASEAVDWLIKKAKSSIDKLFDNSSQNPEAQSNANVECHRDISMLETAEEFNLGSENSVHISEYNSVENSLLFPYFHAGNCSGELGSCYNQQGFVECSGNLDRVQGSGVSSDDEIVKFYISSTQGHRDQEEQNVGFNQQAFLMQASHLE